MTQDFLYTIHLAGCGTFGLIPKDPPKDINWREIFRLGKEHSVIPLIFCAMQKRTDLNCPKEIRSEFEKFSWVPMIQNQMRNEEIIKLLNKAKGEKICSVVLKGAAIGQSYDAPEARTALDTDIYVNSDDEEKMLLFLKQQGFHIRPRQSNFYHTTCVHPKFGVIELHIDLFSENAKNIWFENIDLLDYISLKPYIIKTEYGEIYSIDPTSHLIFICLHFLNHFINSGTSLKMCFDIAAFYNKNKEQIDEDRVYKAIERCNGQKVLKAMFSMLYMADIIIKTGLFNNISDNQGAMELFIDDLEQGGELGRKNLLSRQTERNHNVRKRIISNKGNIGYFIYCIKRWMMRIRLYFLPTKSELLFEYPHLKYIKAYFKHIQKKMYDHLTRKKNIRKTSKTWNENREKLLTIMDILE